MRRSESAGPLGWVSPLGVPAAEATGSRRHTCVGHGVGITRDQLAPPSLVLHRVLSPSTMPTEALKKITWPGPPAVSPAMSTGCQVLPLSRVTSSGLLSPMAKAVVGETASNYPM